jgi:TonB family protein
MKSHNRILSLTALLALAVVSPASAQQTLFVRQGDKFSPVVAMSDTSPQIIVDGKAGTPKLAGTGYAYALGKAEAYAPVVLTVSKLSMTPPNRSGNQTFIGGEAVDSELSIVAVIESPSPVKDVFLAIEVKGERSQYNTLITHEVGNMKPRIPVTVEFKAPIATVFATCTTVFHLFAERAEVLHSAMPAGQVDRELDLMVQKQIQGTVNAAPAPFICPAPAYPAAATGIGNATVAFTVTATGTVTNATLKDATSPEFGEAALKAVSQWRFLPRIKDGQPVATKVALPLTFNVPVTAALQ